VLHFFEEHKQDLGIFLTNNDVLDISFYCERSDFTSILKVYGLNVLRVLLKYQESLDNYEICSLIVNSVEKHNKNFGTNFKI